MAASSVTRWPDQRPRDVAIDVEIVEPEWWERNALGPCERTRPVPVGWSWVSDLPLGPMLAEPSFGLSLDVVGLSTVTSAFGRNGALFAFTWGEP